MMKQKIYRKINTLPSGRASDAVTDGCLVLEGGGWKGLYTAGALDFLMLHGINLKTTVGISAGALFGLGYVCGQIGWAARLDLTFRHDTNYCGIGAMKKDHGVTGFTYLYNDLLKKYPMDAARLRDPSRRFLVGATDMNTGSITYFEKGHCNILRAVQASATVPYVSRPVVIGGVPYLDGGCSVKIPYEWAKEQGEKKIVVIKTKEWSYRRKETVPAIAKVMYHRYPEFIRSMERAAVDFNNMTEDLLEKDRDGSVFVLAPSREVTVKRFEGDMEKLGDLYWMGYRDMEERLEELESFLTD